MVRVERIPLHSGRENKKMNKVVMNIEPEARKGQETKRKKKKKRTRIENGQEL